MDVVGWGVTFAPGFPSDFFLNLADPEKSGICFIV